jgi:glutaminyl-tRNA synthetase
MYDFTHCLSDMMEGITHSICTLEFENNRALYDWVLDALETPCHPQQIEFARLNLSYTVLSKRKLIELVERGIVSGWDDPRMPTISGYRRRGYTPEALRSFCDRIGVARADSTVDIGLLEHCLREDLNKRAPRFMAVLRPLKVTLVNYPEGRVEELEAVNNPEDPAMGSRRVPFSRELYIEREDFMEDPPRKFFRLAPGREVRLRYAYFIRCEEVVKDPASGEVTELRCTYDPATRGGDAPDGRKCRGPCTGCRRPTPCRPRCASTTTSSRRETPGDVEAGRHFTDDVNPNSLKVLTDCRLEPRPGACRTRQLLPVRARGVFLCGPAGEPAGAAGFQPLGDLEGHLGQDRQAGQGPIASKADGSGRTRAPAIQ